MIYLTGDTHGDLSRLTSANWPKGKSLSKRDYLIILGDFGVLWNPKEDSSSKYWLNWLSKKPWTTLFLDGNHENFDLVDNFSAAIELLVTNTLIANIDIRDFIITSTS
jgi:hypothetical protein